jgi:uncharacterized protein YceH (UPF0502 family)
MPTVDAQELSPEELRVLGALVEKEATTPEQYPLTLNSLLSACNQTSNRFPIVSWGADTLEEALNSLRRRGLARAVLSPGQRATKYRHVVGEALGLTSGEVGVLAVLWLRGPQTEADLRTRTERYPAVEALGGVRAVLDRLATRYDPPMVVLLARGPGQREDRWAHTLGQGAPDAPPAPAGTVASAGPARVTGGSALSSSATAELGALRDESAQLRTEMEALRAEVSQLRAETEHLRQQLAPLLE